MLKRTFIGLTSLLVIGVAGFAAFAWRPAIAPIALPAPSSFPADLIARGEILAGAGYCATCHTAPGGAFYAGGYAMRTGFGTIYSTNITPDVETGIGSWSEAAFRRAMHEGVARDGSHLFPAFPYDHFTKLTDADVAALYAYMMTRAPVRAAPHDNGLPFPLNLRPLQAGWKLLFFQPGRYVEQPARGDAWNRGAYLAEGISHCGACHTPRNALGAEERGQAFAGAPVDSWVAPPLTKANPSPVPWSQDELSSYLRGGVSRFHGVAAGPMSTVVHDGLARLPDADISALGVYFADVGQAAARSAEARPAIEWALAVSARGPALPTDPAARLYAAACASCHFNGGGQINALRPDLALNSAVSLSDPTNLIQVMLFGVSAREGALGIVMPGFASGFNDSDIARIAAYLRASRTTLAAWPDLEKTVAAVRAQGRGKE